jgi:hypothetical protein
LAVNYGEKAVIAAGDNGLRGDYNRIDGVLMGIVLNFEFVIVETPNLQGAIRKSSDEECIGHGQSRHICRNGVFLRRSDLHNRTLRVVGIY